MLAREIVAVLVLGLMCGSELNVAVFSHPALNRQPLEAHIAVRSSLARVFGRVMPFWMASSTLLNLLLIALSASQQFCMASGCGGSCPSDLCRIVFAHCSGADQ